MQQAKRMYLIPEDVYQQTFQQQQQPDSGTPMGHVRARMRQIQQQQNDDNIDAQAAKFHQEFKRMNKLARDDEERPLDVRLRNFQEIADALPPPTVQSSSRKKINLATRRRRNGRPKKTKVVKGNNNNEQEEEEKEEEEEEEWADASNENPPTPPKLRQQRPQHSPSGRSSSAKKENARAELRQHIRQHAKELGITADGHVLKADGATVWKTSNVEEIIAHLANRDKMSQFRQTPTGYREFVGRARGDPFLQKYLLQPQQQGKGFPKTHKKMLPPAMIKFKPTLW